MLHASFGSFEESIHSGSAKQNAVISQYPNLLAHSFIVFDVVNVLN